MKSILLVSAALLLAGTARAQGGISGSSISPITIEATPMQSYARISRQCNCAVVSARNDGAFSPSAFENYDQAIQEGELAIKEGSRGVAEIARLNREKKKTTPQAAAFVAVQDDSGKVVVSSQKQ